MTTGTFSSGKVYIQVELVPRAVMFASGLSACPPICCIRPKYRILWTVFACFSLCSTRETKEEASTDE